MAAVPSSDLCLERLIRPGPQPKLKRRKRWKPVSSITVPIT